MVEVINTATNEVRDLELATFMKNFRPINDSVAPEKLKVRENSSTVG